MRDLSYLDWPFFEARHRALEPALDAWATTNIAQAHVPDVDAACRQLVRQLGQAGWLAHAVGKADASGLANAGAIDTRAICLIRETLARHSGLADFAFAMQGLGSGAISLFGSADNQARYLPRVASGDAIAAFALSEPDAGSDVAAMQCAAVRDGDDYVLDGEKTWISNGGIAHFYVVFARTGGLPGARGISAFIVDADTPGFAIAERINVIAPHPLARLKFTGCRVLPHNAWARRGRASRWPWPPWTCSAPRWRRRRSALHGAPSMKRWRTPGRARCSARRWPTSS